MKNLWTIIKKELRRFYTDPKMLFALLMPGLIIFILYSLIGDYFANVTSGENETYVVRIENEPEGYNFLVGENYKLLDETPSDIKTLIENDKVDLYVVYAPDFLDKLALNDPRDPAVVNFYYSASSIKSMNVYQMYSTILDQMLDTYVSRPFQINVEDYSTSGSISMTIMASMMPFLLMSFLFSGAMAVAPESIAGEKERGTIASLLITPIKRSSIAIGKVIALSLVALLSATSSFLGIMLSMPKLAGTHIDFSIYSFGTYVLLFLVIISTILLFIMIISTLSAYAKSIKEANSLSAILMIVIMAAGVIGLIGPLPSNNAAYLVPILNSVNILRVLFGGKFMLVPFVLTIVGNLAFTALGVFLLTRMFNSERFMFRH